MRTNVRRHLPMRKAVKRSNASTFSPFHCLGENHNPPVTQAPSPDLNQTVSSSERASQVFRCRTCLKHSPCSPLKHPFPHLNLRTWELGFRTCQTSLICCLRTTNQLSRHRFRKLRRSPPPRTSCYPTSTTSSRIRRRSSRSGSSSTSGKCRQMPSSVHSAWASWPLASP